MKKVNSYFWKGLLAGIILLGALLNGQGQEEIIDLDGHGEVQITYVIVSDKAPGIQINNLPNQTFDIAEHGFDTELRIIIKVLELDEGYTVKLCKVCYNSTYNQFSRLNTPQKVILRGGESRIRYKFNASKKGGTSSLALSLDLMKNSLKQTRFNSKGQRYTVTNSKAVQKQPGTTTPTVPRPESITTISVYEELEEANQNANTIATICRNKAIKLSKEQKNTEQGRDIVERCKPYLTQIMTIEQEWKTVFDKMQRETLLHKQRRIVEPFTKKYGAHQEAKRILAEIKKQEAALIKPNKPAPVDHSEQEKAARVAKNFTLNEVGSRFDDGTIVEVTIQAEHYEGMEVDLSVPNDVVWTRQTVDKFILRIPKGVERVITGRVIGVSLVQNKKSRIKINTERDPVTAIFAHDKETDTHTITVKDGFPPYTLHVIEKERGAIADAIDIKGNKYEFKPAEHSKIAKGDYYLQVIDTKGAYRNAARTPNSISISGSWRSYIIAGVIIGLVLLVGLSLYFKSEKIKDKRKLSEAEKTEIAEQVAKRNAGSNAKEKEGVVGVGSKDIDPASHIQIVAQTSSDESAKVVRPKITVKRKSKDVKTTELAGASSAAYPRLLKFGSNEVPANLLIAPPSDYRRINMLDVWKKSLVSQIYVRDTFIYRINRFVFEDNKSFLDGRGENIPEIGGWILGRYHQSDGDNPTYTVVFERFIQLHRPADQSTTQIAFGPNAWHDIDKAIDLYREEELKLVGWFHTHPGWGVFLSGPDINAHNTIFKRPYQIAMELESVNEPHDVGFFSRYEEGGVNKLNNRAEGYHHWSDFSKWLKLS